MTIVHNTVRFIAAAALLASAAVQARDTAPVRVRGEII
ncbi:MAG: hypothetical protein JWR40_2205, partial [Massilia sp.]|nr:hypothetical protein [Massilia sp.]